MTKLTYFPPGLANIARDDLPAALDERYEQNEKKIRSL